MTWCRLLGHRWRSYAAGTTIRWDCGAAAPRAARCTAQPKMPRGTRALDRRDSDSLGRRPLLSLLPVALARRASKRR